MGSAMCPKCGCVFDLKGDSKGLMERVAMVVGYEDGIDYYEHIIQTLDYCPDRCDEDMLRDTMREFVKNLENRGFVINDAGDFSIRTDKIVKVYYKKL